MKFGEALESMKQGKKVKLPSWGGFWCWNEEKQTIEMHCRPGNSDTGNPVMDIRETQRVEYTLRNIISDEWVIADEENTPILGGIATFGFGDAIKYLKRGMKVARTGWNGKEQFLYLVKGESLEYTTSADMYCLLDKEVPHSDVIAIKTTSGVVQVGWLASQTDMLAEDWKIVE